MRISHLLESKVFDWEFRICLKVRFFCDWEFRKTSKNEEKKIKMLGHLCQNFEGFAIFGRIFEIVGKIDGFDMCVWCESIQNWNHNIRWKMVGTEVNCHKIRSVRSKIFRNFLRPFHSKFVVRDVNLRFPKEKKKKVRVNAWKKLRILK